MNRSTQIIEALIGDPESRADQFLGSYLEFDANYKYYGFYYIKF